MVALTIVIRIYGDFNQVDEKGRIVLNYPDDTKSERVELKEGMRVVVWDGCLEAEAVLEFEEEEWRARLVPGTGRQRRRPVDFKVA